MASNDLYGDGEIPLQVQEFLQQFDQLQQEIDSIRPRPQNHNQPDLSKGEVEIGTVEDADGTLPGASLEGEKIARLFNIPSDRRLRGRTQATVSNYRQLAKQVNILHSSHHAQSRLDFPLESILKLADGTITLGQLLTPGWRLRNLRDVFLSCCETNLGITQNADDIFTLATGFLCAGAKSVVTTLWAVDDLSAALFCIFYYQRRHQGYSRSQAVQKAQEKLRSMTGEELCSYLQQEARQAEAEYQQARKKLKQIEKNTPEYQELVSEKENSDRIAKNFRNLWKQAKQVYLNTLAVFAVETFLEEISFPPDLQAGDSWNAGINRLSFSSGISN